MNKFKLSARQLDETEDWKKKIVTPRIASVGIVMSPDEKQLLMIKRKYPPYGIAFPGGMVNLGETIDEAVIREVREETGVDAETVGILNIMSDPKNDPRWHVVIVHFIMETVSLDLPKPKAGDDALDAFWVDIDKIKDLDTIDSCKKTLKHFDDWVDWERNLLEVD
jgi:8-oxo-dGTP diphosphatase